MSYQIATEAFFDKAKKNTPDRTVEVPQNLSSILASYTSLSKINFTKGKASPTASYIGGVTAWTLPSFKIKPEYHLIAQLNFANTSNNIGLTNGILQIFSNRVGHNRAFYISRSDFKTMVPHTTSEKPYITLAPSTPNKSYVMNITKVKPTTPIPNAMVFGPYLNVDGKIDELVNFDKFGKIGNSNIPRYRILSIDGSDMVLNVWLSPDDMDLSLSQECGDDVCDVDYTSWAY